MQKINETSFSQFGSIYFHPIASERYDLKCRSIKIINTEASSLFCFDCEVYIELTNGIGSIIIGKNPDLDDLSVFPIHHCLRLKPMMYFNIFSSSSHINVNLLSKTDSSPNIVPLKKKYIYSPISLPFSISQIFDCSYIKHETPCSFYKAHHNYYELLYVCQGFVSISEQNGNNYKLNTHDIVFLTPNNKGSRHFSLNTSCSYLSCVLDIDISHDTLILNQVFSCSVELQSLLWRTIQESLSISQPQKLSAFCHIQEVIAELINIKQKESKPAISADTENFQSSRLKSILSYIEAKTTEPLTVEDICHEFFISRSSLQALFKASIGCSPKNYIINLKLEKSKEMILKNQYTISEISYLLGFSSIHYFSRLFKKYFDISPSQFANSVEPVVVKNDSEK